MSLSAAPPGERTGLEDRGHATWAGGWGRFAIARRFLSLVKDISDYYLPARLSRTEDVR